MYEKKAKGLMFPVPFSFFSRSKINFVSICKERMSHIQSLHHQF